MSKKLSISILTLLTLLVAIQAAEFVTAPQSPADYIKSQIAMKRVENRVQDVFENDGRAGVEMMANYPVTEMGYSFTVNLVFGSDDIKGYTCDIIEAFVSLYPDPNEANLATGLDFYDKKVLETWDAPFQPPFQRLVAYTTALRSNKIELQRVRRLG